MKSYLKYVNLENDICYLLMNDEECYVLNTTKLTVFKPRFTDGLHGVLLFIDENINYIIDNNELKEIIDDFFDSKEYPNLYQKLKKIKE